MVFCGKCGFENNNNARYCQECGYTLINNSDVNKTSEVSDLSNHFQSDEKVEKFNTEMRNSGLLTLGLGVFLGLFADITAGLITIFFGALLLLVKRVEILAVVGAIIIMFGFYNLSFNNNYGYIQILMALTFFYAFYKYK